MIQVRFFLLQNVINLEVNKCLRMIRYGATIAQIQFQCKTKHF